MNSPFRRSARPGAAALVLALATATPAHAQLPVTRADAERAALASGTRIAIARADSAAALAKLLTARTLPNPNLSASYSKATPQKHITLDVPLLGALYLRGAKVGQANAAARAARLLYASERAAVLVEVDTTYTQALAANARFRLSRQTARDADSLRTMTVARRNAGDAADLDVDLATVVAGQAFNVASDDSLSYMTALLTVQTLMGLPADSVQIVLADSLLLSPRDTTLAMPLWNDSLAGITPAPNAGVMQPAGAPGVAMTPSVAAAEASVQAADAGIVAARRAAIPIPSLTVGVEFGDPSGSEPGLLPLIGVALPLPIFDRNRGPIAEATAERDRARAELAVARLEARKRLVEGQRERATLLAKIARDRELVIRANVVATKSITAYREGASALPAVLEARRSAREVLGQYIADVAALLTVNAELRALTQPIPAP